jgi:hypothetical protein
MENETHPQNTSAPMQRSLEGLMMTSDGEPVTKTACLDPQNNTLEYLTGVEYRSQVSALSFLIGRYLMLAKTRTSSTLEMRPRVLLSNFQTVHTINMEQHSSSAIILFSRRAII